MSLNVNFAVEVTAVETFTGSAATGITQPRVTHEAFNGSAPASGSLNASSSVPVSVVSEQTLGDASGTIDLAALPTVGGTVDCTGLKLQIIRISNRGANDFVIDEGASNGYPLTDPITVQPGGCAFFSFAEGLADVAAGDKTLDYTFDAADEADITLILG